MDKDSTSVCVCDHTETTVLLSAPVRIVSPTYHPEQNRQKRATRYRNCSGIGGGRPEAWPSGDA